MAHLTPINIGDSSHCPVFAEPESASNRLDVFPAMVKVKDRSVVILGGGEEAAAKLRLLLETNANLKVFAPQTGPAMRELITHSDVHWFQRSVTFEDLADAALVFTAQEDEALDELAVETARMVGVPVNAVDRPHLCDFITPSIVNRSPVLVAVSTNGSAPVLARRLKAEIEKLLHPRLGALARFADAFRPAVSRLKLPSIDGRRFWERFFDGKPARAMLQGNSADACHSACELLAQTGTPKGRAQNGHVALVGAGPGAEDLLTIRAHRLLQNADVVLTDALVPRQIVSLARRDAEIIDVGKRKGRHSKSQAKINPLIVEKARAGKRVVRLKSGDPMVFGRAAEEIGGLRAHNISHEIVPGITAALAAASEVALPVTLRGTASSVVLTTGHDLNGTVLPDWAGLALHGSTVCVYMSRTVARKAASRLVQAGLPENTPVAVLDNVSRPNARHRIGTVGDLMRPQPNKSKDDVSLLIIGEAVAAADLSQFTALNPATIQPQAKELAA